MRTGDAFDVTLQSEIESRDRITAAEYERSARYRVIEDGEPTRTVEVERAVDYWRTTMRYTLTNAKPEPVVVEMSQGGLHPEPWSPDFHVVSEDVAGEQVNADRRLYRVEVPANGKRVVRVTYETRF